MTQQQSEPNVLPPNVQEVWDVWCDARIDRIVEPALDGLAEEAGMIAGQLARKIFEILEIMQALAAGNDYLRGRLDQITREFKHQNGIEHKETTVATIEERHSEHHSESSKVVSVMKR